MANLEDLRIDTPVPKPRRKRPSPVPWLIVLALALWLGWRYGGDRVQNIRASMQPARSVQVYTVPAARGPAGSFTAGGYIEVIPPGPHIASALIDGQLKELLVKPGDRVKRGQLIARLDGSLLAQDVAVQRSEVQLAQANLTKMRSGFRGEEVAQARAVLSQAQSRLQKAEADLARFEQLFSEGIVSRAEYEVHTTAVSQAQGDVDSRQAALDLLLAGQRDVDISIAQRQVGSAQAQLTRSQAVLAMTEIRAPADGVVLELFAHPGTWVTPNDGMTRAGQICSIFDPRSLQAWADINQRDIASIKVGQQVTLTSDVQPDKPLRGHVSVIMPGANLQKNTVQVKLAIDEQADYLRPEMTVQVAFIPDGQEVDTSARVVMIPRAAVIEVGGTISVFVLENGKAAARTVELGSESGSEVGVLSGVGSGDKVIVDPQGIRAGMSVTEQTTQAETPEASNEQK